ncbi:MAG: leucine-rich repeat protein [Christensenellales bacterium]
MLSLKFNGVEYALEGDHYVVSKVKSVGNVVIKDTYKDKPVTSISKGAFKDAIGVKGVVVPDSVVDIEEGAFAGASNIENLTLPFVGARREVVYGYYDQYNFGYIFGEEEFSGGEATEQVYLNQETELEEKIVYYIPKSLKEVTITSGQIAYGAFSNCVNIESVSVKEGVEKVGDYAFLNNDKLSNFVCENQESTMLSKDTFAGTKLYDEQEDGVFYVGNVACGYKGNIANGVLRIKSGTVSIAERAFDTNQDINKIYIPDSLKRIGASAFDNADGAREVHISDLNSWCQIVFDNPKANPLTYAHDLYLNGWRIVGLTLPNGLSKVNSNAFTGCSIEYLTIPNSITTIDSLAFYNCDNLTTVNLGNNVEVIGRSAFESCNQLESIAIPNSVNKIDVYAFAGCSALKTVNIDHASPITTIPTCTFWECVSLKEFTIPDSVVSIGESAFSECYALAKVNFNSKLTNIGKNAFFKCQALTDAILPDSLVELDVQAFYNCAALNRVVIPKHISKIPYATFAECYGLTSIEFSEDIALTTIEDKAFQNCNNEDFTTIALPDTLQSVGEDAFKNCSHLTSVYITDLKEWCSIEFKNPEANPLMVAHDLYLNGTKVDILEVPSGVDKIGSAAFANANFSSVTIAEGVKTINPKAFIFCNLSTLYLPASLEELGYNAFYGCKNLTSVAIPSKVSVVQEKTFAKCEKLESVSFSNGSLAEIGAAAFWDCYALESAEIPTSVTQISESAFSNCTSLRTASFPGVTTLQNNAFYGCTSLSTVVIPSTVTIISDNAFSKCSSITSLTLQDGVQTIGVDAFWACTSLQSVTLPQSVEYIKDNAFSGCYLLSSCNLPNGLKEIGNNAFYDCLRVSSVFIPASVTTIGYSAFSSHIYDNNLVEINVDSNNKYYYSQYNCIVEKATKTLIQGCNTSVIPSDVTAIGQGAFAGCKNLTYVEIPTTVTKINDYAFESCTNLTIKYRGSRSQWAAITKGEKWNGEGTTLVDIIITYDN